MLPITASPGSWETGFILNIHVFCKRVLLHYNSVSKHPVVIVDNMRPEHVGCTDVEARFDFEACKAVSSVSGRGCYATVGYVLLLLIERRIRVATRVLSKRNRGLFECINLEFWNSVSIC